MSDPARVRARETVMRCAHDPDDYDNRACADCIAAALDDVARETDKAHRLIHEGSLELGRRQGEIMALRERVAGLERSLREIAGLTWNPGFVHGGWEAAHKAIKIASAALGDRHMNISSSGGSV